MNTNAKQVGGVAETLAGDRLVTIAETARYLSVSSRHVWRMISRHELPQPVKVGRSTRLCVSDVGGYVERLKLRRAPAGGRAAV
jgi:excisionase family DNA binding protein